MKIYDDFLGDEDFYFLQSNFLGNNFPWYNTHVLHPINEKEDLDCDEIDNIQLHNWLYLDNVPRSRDFDLVRSILIHPTLKVSSVLRVKANMNMRTPEIIKHGFHTDGYGNFRVAIYYVNTNDGYTEFEDGTKVESVENRLVVFPSMLKHTGTTCTDTKVRCVINFNYYSAKD